MINKVILVGNLGDNPEIKTTKNGDKFAKLSLATNKKAKNAEGKLEDKTTWHTITVWDPKISETLESYTKVGSKLYVEGEIEIRTYTNSEGKKVYAQGVVVPRYSGVVRMLDSKSANTATANKTNTASDDIPFDDQF